jgi:formate hydrogenlyase transcriptional activator
MGPDHAQPVLPRRGSGVKDSADQLRDFIDSIPTLAWSAASDGSAESFNQRWLDYTGLSAPAAAGWGWKGAIHPDDLSLLLEAFHRARESGLPFEFEARLRRLDGTFRRFLMRGNPVRDEQGNVVKWYGTNTDLEDRARAEDALRLSAEGLRRIVDTIPGLVAIMTAGGEVELVNQRVLEYFGRTLEELKHWGTSDAIHPDDLPGAIAAWKQSVETGTPYDFEHRLRRADGTYRWFQSRGHPLRDGEGRVIRWYNLLTDIDDRKRAEEALRKSEERWRAVFDNSAIGVALTDQSGRFLATNSAYQKMLGYTEAEIGTLTFLELTHEGYRESNRQLVTELLEGKRTQFQIEKQYRRKDGGLIWVSNNVSLVPGTKSMPRFLMALSEDITEVKRLRDQLRDENLVLRQEIDHAFMFEEIIGSSPVLQAVLSSITKVAPTDSTVLIAGETGTGKELIARAIHKHSRRSEKVFISVNCAAIPPSLIASELFGHEKGAFTGAVQQRRGRFELAHSGTIFLDEIGEIPAETQVALLRVLQERHFERVGGGHAIPTDVRVIAATNRNLAAAVSEGTFRSDLYYRLNVFPIQVPPLRARKEDIPLLVEYFVRKCAEQMGKRIRRIDKRTLELCQRYEWPGNIRELQNIIERSVILCGGDTLSIDEAWLPDQSPVRPLASSALTEAVQDREKQMIEAALAESKGRVAGAKGAAGKLGIPASTLESKIKQLKIVKRRFTGAG